MNLWEIVKKYEDKKYSLFVEVYTDIDDYAGSVLIGSSKFSYDSIAKNAITQIIDMFEQYFGYIVNYNISMDTEIKTYTLTLYLKNKPEEPENPDEGEKIPIDPPEEEPEEPTDPEEGENSEEGKDATDEETP